MQSFDAPWIVMFALTMGAVTTLMRWITALLLARNPKSTIARIFALAYG